MDSPKDELDRSSREKDFLYSVLNLPKSASQIEIKERHRALSLIFHPDKQHDEETKDIAAKKFLEIQKAYEVLSDPFLREVYDTLGERGLSRKWPAELRNKPTEELRDILKRATKDWSQQKLENMVRPKGHLTCGIDAASLFGPYVGSPRDQWHEKLLHRLEDVRLLSFSIRHSIQKELSDNTKISLAARLARPGSGSFFGTLRHQFSPRLTLEASSALLRPHVLSLKTTYRDGENTLSIRTHISSRIFRLFPPPITLSLARKLFRESSTEGILSFNTGPQPYVSLNVFSPTPFDLSSESFNPSPRQTHEEYSLRPASVSGFSTGARYWTCGFVLDNNPRLSTGWGVTFSELAIQVKISLECGLNGLAWMFAGTWANETSEVAASVSLIQGGVVMKLDLAYLEQRFSVPIVLSQEYDLPVAFWTVLVPSTAFVLGYHFFLKPRRRAQHLAYIRAARRALDAENSAIRRETEATASLLKDTAKKHMQAESSKGGLVILEATYGSIDIDEVANDLIVDVTVPIQALIRSSQLHIPSHRTKSGIQGFCDPAPFASKSLRIRYLFRGRTHYADIPDYLPVVLPLADHLVE